MKHRIEYVALSVSIALVVGGCGQESAIDQIVDAANNSSGVHGVPDIVREQQRKERIRQNTQWTAENQAQYPEEYCLAQLEAVRRYSEQLEVSNHKLAVALSATKRKMNEAQTQASVLSRFLEDSRRAYRIAETAKTERVQVNGRRVSRKEAQDAIVEAFQRLQDAQNAMPSQRLLIEKIDVKFQKIAAEQKKLARLNEKIRSTLEDVRMKKVINGKHDIDDALNAISDSMGALQEDPSILTLDELLTPPSDAVRQETFEAIMSK